MTDDLSGNKPKEISGNQEDDIMKERGGMNKKIAVAAALVLIAALLVFILVRNGSKQPGKEETNTAGAETTPDAEVTASPEEEATETPPATETPEAIPEKGYRILGLKNLPALLSERKLTDDEVLQMGIVDLDTLKEKISTFADFAAWFRNNAVDKLEFYNKEATEDDRFVFGAQYAYPLLEYWFAPNMTVSIAQYVLEDDYPGIGRLFILLESDDDDVFMRCADYIPADGGYYIVNAELFSNAKKSKLMEACNMDDLLFVTDLEDLLPYLEKTYPGNKPLQVLAFDSSETVILSPADSWYIPQDTTHVTTIFADQRINDWQESTGGTLPAEPAENKETDKAP